ncbi:hypothetical protein [Clostridium gasigenes]|uniref:Uncharacterized protein n=1 Tax=Clostridium gasigenes TaxID=94869 RepID=A0A7X0VR52_9CLOT|nr:hypothetical protein [Clostridium gasigenes]MBB6715019.1 hypothetical protein [Clostridium gasigenes]
MRNTNSGRYIFIGTSIGLVIGIIISILTNKLVSPILGTTSGFFIGAILERYKSKK